MRMDAGSEWIPPIEQFPFYNTITVTWLRFHLARCAHLLLTLLPFRFSCVLQTGWCLLRQQVYDSAQSKCFLSFLWKVFPNNISRKPQFMSNLFLNISKAIFLSGFRWIIKIRVLGLCVSVTDWNKDASRIFVDCVSHYKLSRFH